jgi:catechol 2,3-dioxygenase-like lactoylglutathione lyase family enzyme
MFSGIGALAIYVKDKERAKEFYINKLGFETAFDINENLCFLRTKNNEVYIYLEGGHIPAKTDEKSCRLSFFLNSELSAKDTFDKLKSNGVNILDEYPKQVDNDKACFRFTDPDGNIIEACGNS